MCVSKGQIRALMVWVEPFRVWVESGCLGGLLRCVRLFCAGDCVGGLCMERMQQEGYQDGFTFYFGNFSVGKRSSNLSTRHPKFQSRIEYTKGRGGYVSVPNIKSYIYGIPHIKYAPLFPVI